MESEQTQKMVRDKRELLGQLKKEIMLVKEVARYYVHEMVKAHHMEAVDNGYITDQEGHHKYSLEMIKYDKIMSLAGHGSFNPSHRISMNSGFYSPQPTKQDGEK